MNTGILSRVGKNSLVLILAVILAVPGFPAVRTVATSQCGNGMVEIGEECDAGTANGPARPGQCTATCELSPPSVDYPPFLILYGAMTWSPGSTAGPQRRYQTSCDPATPENCEIHDDFITAEVFYLGDDEWELSIEFDCSGPERYDLGRHLHTVGTVGQGATALPQGRQGNRLECTSAQ